MSNYFNEAGEPLMDAAAMRYEMYLDSTYEPDPYDESDPRFWQDYEPEPENCTHDGWSYLDSGRSKSGDVQCDYCGTHLGRWALGEDGWPEQVS